VKRWVYLCILVAVVLAVGGWIVQGMRAPFRALRPQPLAA
jgi:hypothetical protein